VIVPLQYFIDLEIGQPPQTVRALVDTGSFDLWVADSTSAICQGQTCPNLRSSQTITVYPNTTYERSFIVTDVSGIRAMVSHCVGLIAT
jgi:hypothetical protein